jgi:hypothetical protein
MSRIDDLKPDQRAALQLLLKQGRSYDEIATMLRIETRAVRERARAALDALGPEDVEELALEDQDDVADYLLGQQSASRRAQTRGLLERSAPARAWARTVASELRPLAGDTLPEIPAEAAEVEQAFDALEARAAHRERTEQSSRVGGAILLFAIALLVAGVLVIVLGGDDDDEGDQGGTATTQTQTAPAGQPQIVGQANLQPPGGGGGNNAPAGVALITREGRRYAVGVQAENMPRTTQNRFYGVWLRGQSGNRFIGFGNAVDQSGQLAGAREVDYDPTRYSEVLVTREPQNEPKQPGEVVLAGEVQKPPAQGQGGAGTGDTGAQGAGG